MRQPHLPDTPHPRYGRPCAAPQVEPARGKFWDGSTIGYELTGADVDLITRPAGALFEAARLQPFCGGAAGELRAHFKIATQLRFISKSLILSCSSAAFSGPLDCVCAPFCFVGHGPVYPIIAPSRWELLQVQILPAAFAFAPRIDLEKSRSARISAWNDARHGYIRPACEPGTDFPVQARC